VTFEHPLLALGAFAGLIPPLLHLFDRRKPRPLPFAAMEFLLRAKRSGARSLRLRRILLMAARMALLAAIPLALARPHRIAKASTSPATLAGPKATVLLLDASGSMRYRRGGTTLFHEAQEAAKRRLQDLQNEEPVSVQICAARSPAVPLPGFDRLAARSAIEQAQASMEPADIAVCLEAAGQALASSTLPAKRIVVFTDLTAAGWDLNRPLPDIPTGSTTVKPEVEVDDVARGPMPNIGLSDLEIRSAPSVGPHGYELSFLVHNYSDTAVQNVPLNLKVGERTLARGFADVAAQGTARKVLAASFDPGARVEGRIETTADALTEDDAIPFVVAVPRQVRVLVVDGAASSLRYLDEAFFTLTALQAAEGAMQVRSIDPDSLTVADLTSAAAATNDLDAVLLLNVRSLSKDVAAALKHFVDKGGGLFIAMGDRVDPDALNESLGSLLPASLRLVKTAAPPPGEAAGSEGAGTTVTGRSAARLSQIDYTSPVFQAFDSATREGLLEAKFYRYLLVEPPPSGSHVLAAYDDGSPAILAANRGAGRVVLYTSSASREWTDWPIRVSFVPVIQQIVLGLAGVVDTKPSAPDVVGTTHFFAASVPPMLAAIAPSGHEIPVEPDGLGRTGVGPLTEVGIYRVKLKEAGTRASTAPDFAVAFDPRESDTRRLDGSELAARQGARVSTTTGPLDEEHRGVPLWTELLGAAALLFLAESLLLG
jgi:hypothetical protein